MKNVKRYLLLHFNILLVSFTGVFSKAASNCYKREGLFSLSLYLFLGLMVLNCLIYALAWQKTIKYFDLNVAYANKSVYLLWSQVWAIVIFKEILTFQNIVGLFIVLVGVLIVQKDDTTLPNKEKTL